MSDEQLRADGARGDASVAGHLEIVISDDRFVAAVGEAGTGTPAAPVYEPAAGAAIALEDDGE